MKIYYLKHSSVDINLFLPHSETIKELIERGTDAHGLNLEKLRKGKHIPIYSIRINDANRILMVKYRGDFCLVDVINDHDYRKSRFYNDPSLFKALLSGTGVAVEALSELLLDEEPWGKIETLDELVKTSDEFLLKPLEYQQQRIINFNVAQEQALHAVLPAIISGPAGSGKSCVALSMLDTYLREHARDVEAFPILYLSHNPYLVKKMKDIWQDMLPGPEYADYVKFKTYNQILAEILGVDEDIFVDEKDFLAWYRSFAKKTILTEWDVWKECRIRSGYTKDDDYLRLGVRQSTIDNPTERQFICGIYKSYIAKTKRERRLAPALDLGILPDKIAGKYKFIVVDEAQDCSSAALKNLYRLSRGSIVFFLGDHQLIYDDISRSYYLKELFYREGKPENLVVLDVTYRCSKAVAAVADELIKMKLGVTKGAPDKISVNILKVADDYLADDGVALLLQTPRDAESIEIIKAQAKVSTQCAVITLEKFREEAKAEFGPMVFTPEEAKGLEFNRVVLWRPLDCDDATEAGQIVSASSDSVPSGHRAKAGMRDVEYETFFNALITAVTRAQKEVFIVQNKNHNSAPILERLSKVIGHKKHREALFQALPASAESEWVKELIKYYNNGNHKQALGIYISKLSRSEDTYESFLIEQGLIEIKPAEKVAYKPEGGAGRSTSVSEKLIAADEDEIIILEKLSNDELVHEAQIFKLKQALSDKKGRLLFELLNKGHHKLLQKLGDDLFNLIPPDAWSIWIGKKASSKPLLILLSSEEIGYSIFQRVMKPEFNISDAAWKFTANDAHGHFSGMSIPYLLCSYDEGRIIFSQLIQKSPDKKKSIQSSFLTTAPKNCNQVFPLSMLISSINGVALLTSFIKLRPDLLKSVSTKSWLTKIRLYEEADSKNLSDVLNETKYGRRFLELYKDQLPNLCEAIYSSKIPCKPTYKPTIAWLVGLLRNEIPQERERAAGYLSRLAIDTENKIKIAAVENSLERLVKLLSDKHAGVRIKAAEALSNLASYEDNQIKIAAIENSLESLVKLLSDVNAEVRKNAAAALFNLALNKDNEIKIAAIKGSVCKGRDVANTTILSGTIISPSPMVLKLTNSIRPFLSGFLYESRYELQVYLTYLRNILIKIGGINSREQCVLDVDTENHINIIIKESKNTHLLLSTFVSELDENLGAESEPRSAIDTHGFFFPPHQGTSYFLRGGACSRGVELIISLTQEALNNCDIVKDAAENRLRNLVNHPFSSSVPDNYRIFQSNYVSRLSDLRDKLSELFNKLNFYIKPECSVAKRP